MIAARPSQIATLAIERRVSKSARNALVDELGYPIQDVGVYCQARRTEHGSKLTARYCV
jgi:hypothetical protein